MSAMTAVTSEACRSFAPAPGAALTGTLIFIVTAVSFDRCSISALLPLLLYPAAGCWLFRVSPARVGISCLKVLPLCLLGVGFNVFILTDTAAVWCGLHISYGMLSVISVTIKCLLTVSALQILTGIHPLHRITWHLRRLHFPTLPLTLSDLIMRYYFIILEEAATMLRAYRLTSGRRLPPLKMSGDFLGSLLLRSASRAERVYQAMQLMDFAAARTPGYVPQARSGLLADCTYVAALTAFCIGCRLI